MTLCADKKQNPKNALHHSSIDDPDRFYHHHVTHPHNVPNKTINLYRFPLT